MRGKENHPADEVLSALLDGDLSPRHARAARAHLESCPSCSERYGRMERLRQQLRLMGEVQPPERIWQAVRSVRPAAKEKTGRAVWLVPLVSAAAAAMVWFGLSWLEGGNRKLESELAVPQEALAAVEKAEMEYEEAIQMLAAVWKEQKSNDTTLRMEVEHSMTVIDDAIARIKQHLKSSPDDLESRQQLLGLYQRKVDLLGEVVLGDGN